jgi:hypothetical protein
MKGEGGIQRMTQETSEFAQEGSDGELVIDDATKRCILNINELELVLDGSKIRAGGSPEVSFYDPRLPMAKRPIAKSAYKCTGILGSSAAGECTPIHFQFCESGNDRKWEESSDQNFQTHPVHSWEVWTCRRQRFFLHRRDEREGWNQQR